MVKKFMKFINMSFFHKLRHSVLKGLPKLTNRSNLLSCLCDRGCQVRFFSANVQFCNCGRCGLAMHHGSLVGNIPAEKHLCLSTEHGEKVLLSWTCLDCLNSAEMAKAGALRSGGTCSLSNSKR